MSSLGRPREFSQHELKLGAIQGALGEFVGPMTANEIVSSTSSLLISLIYYAFHEFEGSNRRINS